MGASWKKMSSYFGKEEARILMQGLDAAGKTTILYVTKLGEVVTTIPTIGFNVETLSVGNVTFTAWDVGGRDKIRPLWRHYYQNTSGLIFVVDSNDQERVYDARDQLHQTANEDELRDIPILIFANKQDLPNALSIEELTEKLELSKLDRMKVKWHIQPAIATKNEGLGEGFQWLANAVKSKSTLTSPIVETINDTKVMHKDLLKSWNSLNWKSLLSKFI